LFEGAKVVALLPVGVDQCAVGHTFAVGLATVDVGCHQHHLVLCDHQAVRATELAVDEVAVVIDVVVAGEPGRYARLAGHHGAQAADAARVLLVGEAVANFSPLSM